MAEKDCRDLNGIKKFSTELSDCLQILHENAQRFQKLSSSCEVTLGQTEFATKASENLAHIAQQLAKATSSGEERVREIERKANEALAGLSEFER